MRIAIFTDTFVPSINGVAGVAYKSAVALSDLGHSVMVVTVSKKTPEEFELLSGGKFKVAILPSLPFWGYSGERLTLPLGFAIKKIAEFKPDVIHTHTPFPVGIEAVIAGKLFKIPVVGTHHTFYDHYLKHIKMDFAWFKKPSWKLVTAYYNRCAMTLSPSRSLAETLRLNGLKKPIEVFPNPIDTDLFIPVADVAEKKALKESFGVPAQSLVYMGRVSYEKSIDVLIRMTAIIAKTIPDITLMIVGDGPERKNLEALARELGIEKNVVFTGFKRGQDLISALQANDIFVTASKSENMPLSVLEGMAAGLPVIGVDSLGIPEIVRNNINGFISEPDNFNEMAEKTIKLLRDKTALDEFSKASRSLALEHSREQIGRLLQKLYQDLSS